MIRTGEKYIVESRQQFINRTQFTKLDALEANDIDIVERAKEVLPDTEFEPKTVDDVPRTVIDECFAELSEVIQPTLEADDGEWIHLYDRTVHTIVELEPDERAIWVEGDITGEGVSAELYQGTRRQSTVLDEYWVPWTELIEDEESWAQFQDVYIEPEQFDLEKGQ